LAKTTHTQGIRFTPPLIVTQKDLDRAIEIIEEVKMLP